MIPSLAVKRPPRSRGMPSPRRESVPTARVATVDKLRPEWDRLAEYREDIEDFALRLAGLQQQLHTYGDFDVDEEKVVRKLLRAAPTRYRQLALSIETLLDHSMPSIEDMTGRLLAVDQEELPTE